MENSPTTEREMAPVPPLAPRQMSVERTGDVSAPFSRRFPNVRGGICEYCGVIDPKQPSQYQYKLCSHYRGLQLRCSYCDAAKNPDEVIAHTDMNVAEHPDKPGVMIAWCDSTECSRKHLERFQKNN